MAGLSFVRVMAMLGLVIGVGCLVGCSRQGEREVGNFDPAWTNYPAGIHPADVDRAMTNLAPDELVLCVNGYLMRRRDFEVGVQMYRRVYEMRGGAIPLGDRSKVIESQVDRRRASVLASFIRQTIIEQEAKRLGVTAQAETLSAQTKLIAKSLKLPGKSLEEVGTAIGGEAGEYFVNFVQNTALAEDMLKAAAGDQLKVSEGEIDAYLSGIQDFNRRVAETNATLRRLAFQAWEALKGGSNIVDVAKAYSPLDPEQGEAWGTFTVEEMDIPALRKWVLAHKPGEFSMPMELDDRISVVKLERIQSGAELQDEVSYVLTRVAFPIYLSTPEPESREAMGQIIREQRLRTFRETYMKKLFNEAVICYPNGTNLFPKAQRQRRSFRPKLPGDSKVDASKN